MQPLPPIMGVNGYYISTRTLIALSCFECTKFTRSQVFKTSVNKRLLCLCKGGIAKDWSIY